MRVFRWMTLPPNVSHMERRSDPNGYGYIWVAVPKEVRR